MMKNDGRLPYSDERLAKIMKIDASEFKFLVARDEIKRIVRDYNLFLKRDDIIAELTRVKNEYESNQMTYEAIANLISFIKLI